jgi:hypothetical protein
MKLSTLLLIFIASASLLTGCDAFKGTPSAEKAVNEFHERLDKSDFEGIYSATHSDFKAAETEKEFVALLDAVHRKLGTVKNSEKVGWRVNSFNFKTDVILNYKTIFIGGDAHESFTYRMDGDKAILRGYNINSQTLIVK